MQAQEIATCCRVSFMLWNGKTGPQLARVNLETLFVRDSLFWLRLAEDLKMDASELYAANKLADEERVAYRKLRSECIEISEEVLGVCARLAKNYDWKWEEFKKMIKGQTVRQIVRGRKDRIAVSIADDVRWCAARIESDIGPKKLDKLLTLRALMG